MQNRLEIGREKVASKVAEILELLIDRYSACVHSLKNLDKKKAENLILNSDDIDSLIENVESKIVVIINLNQPIARDLRELIAYIRTLDSFLRINALINNMAISISRISKKKAISPPLTYFDNISNLVKKNLQLLSKALKKLDKKLADNIIEMDKGINNEYYNKLNQFIDFLEKEGQVRLLLRLIDVDKAFESLGDLTKKVAYDILYIS